MTTHNRGNWIVRKVAYPVSPSRVAAPLTDADEIPSPIEIHHQVELVWNGGYMSWPQLGDVLDGIAYCRSLFGVSPDVLVAGFPRTGDTLCGVEVR